MKRTCLFLIISAFTALNACSQDRPSLEDLKWLEGKWNRTNVRAGRTGFEQWTRHSPYEFKGIGATLQGDDTVSVEKLRIILRNDTLYYVADVPENPKPVFFAFTEASSSSFTCENPAHDFPKVIRYVLADGVLTATISGSDRKVDFVFRKE